MAGRERQYRQHVPDLLRDDAGDKKIYFVWRVSGFSGWRRKMSGAEMVCVMALAGRGFDLNPPKMGDATLGGIQNKVVGLGVSIRLGHAEAQGHGFVEESDFNEFSATLGATGRALKIRSKGVIVVFSHGSAEARRERRVSSPCELMGFGV